MSGTEGCPLDWTLQSGPVSLRCRTEPSESGQGSALALWWWLCPSQPSVCWVPARVMSFLPQPGLQTASETG